MIRVGFHIVAVAGIALLAASLPVAASAQGASGTVSGTVKDAQGGVLPGASVVLISETRGTRVAPAVTNAAGDFVLPNVAADTYTIEVTMSSFKTLKRQGIAVHPGDRLAIGTLTIELGGLTDTIDVKGETPLIQAQSGERSFTIATESVQNLPIANRSFTSLTSLAPGVVNGNVNGLSGNLASMDGVSTVDTGGNQILIQMNTDAIAEVKILTSNYQAEYGRSQGIQITAVTKSGTNRFRGSVYDIQRNSDWNSNSWTNKRNGTPKAVTKEQDWGYTLGGPIGRPGGANKLFFFFSQEWRPRTSGGTLSNFRVPTALERQGDFSQSRDNNGALFPYIRDPFSTNPCVTTPTGNHAGCFQDGGVLGRIPAARLYAPGMAILKNLYPIPNVGQDDVRYTSTNSYNYQEAEPTIKSHDSQSAIRLDYQPSSRLRFSGKYILQTRSKIADAVNSQFGSSAGARIKGFTDFLHLHPEVPAISATVNYNVNATTFAEVTFGYSGNDYSNMSVYGDTRAYGLDGLPSIYPNARLLNKDYFAYDRYTEGTKNGTASWFDPATGAMYLLPTLTYGARIANAPPNLRQPLIAFVRTNDLTATVTKVWQQHTIKIGVWHQGSLKYQGSGSTAGSVNFGNGNNNPFDSQFGYANAALGVYNAISQNSTWIEGEWVYSQTDGFIQDNWKVNSKLTLDYGIRFVNQGPQWDKRGALSNFLPNTFRQGDAPRLYNPAIVNGMRVGFDAQTGRTVPVNQIGLIVPGSGNVINGIQRSGQEIVKENYKWPTIAYAPRFGFAYDVTGNQRMVVRGGTGVFYDRPSGNSVFNQIANPPNGLAGTLNNGLLADLSNQTVLISPPALVTFQYEAKLPTAIPWNVGVQMSLPWQSTIDITYAGSHSFNQLISYDVNQIDFGAAYLTQNQDSTLAPSAIPGATALPTNFMRRYVGYGSIGQQSNIGYGNYHSLQTSLNRRFANGVSFGLNYTLGRNMAYAGTPRTTIDADGDIAFRDDDKQANYNLASGDRTHTIKGNFIWDLPDIASQNKAWRAVGLVVNDWQLSGIFSAGSGALYDVGYSYAGGIGNVNLTGSPTYAARVYVNGDPGGGCSDDSTRQFNTSAFAGPQPSSNGLESGVNLLRGCADHIMDLAIARNIRIGSGRQIQLRVDLFNAFNTVIYTGRNTTMNLAGLTTANAPTNLPYDASGALIPGRDIPRTAGFGVVTGAAAPRSVQLQIRFQF